jgi:hypothetical protein
MIRFFVWQCGTIAFVAVIWRYGYWREILPLTVLGAAFLWIVCGGILLSRGGRKGARLAHDSPVDAEELSPAWKAAALRAMEQDRQKEWEQEVIRKARAETPRGLEREK